ncbi:hypothetical protein J437_LFUL017788 [Ladona fulva]|uniref:PiggyBac transposable element-derived protein domain-containing protein n=1 Tax=Ladona fulva TaxID=123851 RepID=A0A8K0KPA7_LADFU|nr:hypothetical protein J437_LFUL017788 [Ladona fulva]
MKSWEKLTCNEFYSQDPLICTTIFGKCMPRDRFILILCCLHFADNGKPSLSDPLWKINNVFSQLKQRFSDVFHPYKKLVIDESIVLFKGHLGFQQYIPSKRHRFGMKLFILCDGEIGIILDMIVYTVKKTDISRSGELGLSGEVDPAGLLELTERTANISKEKNGEVISRGKGNEMEQWQMAKQWKYDCNEVARQTGCLYFVYSAQRSIDGHR